MLGRGHENVATVLVDPDVLRDLELELMAHDFRVWPVETAPTFPDPQRLAFQMRRTMVEASAGEWADAVEWTPVWITFGESWLDGDEPIPWPAHAALWDKLGKFDGHVHYKLGLGGVPRLSVRQEHP